MILTIDQFYPKVAEIRESLDNPVKVLITRISDAFPFPLNIGVHFAAERKNPKSPADADAIYWKAFMRGAGAVSEVPVPTVTCYDAAAILYSGGTTGTTKGILLSSLQLQRPGTADRRHASGYRTIRWHEDALGHAHVPRLRPGHRHPHVRWSSAARCILVPRFYGQDLRRTCCAKSSPTSSRACRRCTKRSCAPTTWTGSICPA